ncbi:glycosyltransferase [Deinococcus yavapaiensis]|uniref:Glycosyltransferase involved in cell wall biosynthesis n=1 Tax=Deinococcus yavapaiensis KR-236 TaxID=694435 RepID=A0A318S2L5_9DEIO|nr:glycosyltransferase [Deinococcus yavapaiensis]PYE49898.1 glycosyltransferase involved in cell wall biosynthesis [Deinococcus yavapaiensis KR-236]
MHIALVTAYPPSRGSLNEYGFHLAAAFRRKREVDRLSILADEFPESENAESDPFYVRRVWRFNDPGNATRLLTELRRLKPDVVLFNLQFASFGDRRVPAALGLLAPILASRAGFPTITLLHNIFETVDLDKAGFGGNPMLNAVTRLAGRVFTRVLLGSDLVAFTLPRYVEIIRRDYGARNVFLAPHGSFETPEPPTPLPSDPVVMAFGKFGTYKRVEELVEAHRVLLTRDPRVHLVIAGSDSPNAAGYLQSVRERYADVPNITYTGYVAEEDVPRIFRDSTVVAFPYNSTTGSSGVLHQAGQFARAAVMPNIGDLRDLIEEEGYRAEFFETGDAASLAEALWRVVSDSEHARELGLANHRAASGLTLDEVTDWYVLHFQRLLAQQAARRDERAAASPRQADRRR